MAKIVSIGKASAHPKENIFRADFSSLHITINGNRVDNKLVMRAYAGDQGKIDYYRFDMSGNQMMLTAKLPDTIEQHGKVSIQGSNNPPCAFCHRVRNTLLRKEWWKQ